MHGSSNNTATAHLPVLSLHHAEVESYVGLSSWLHTKTLDH